MKIGDKFYELMPSWVKPKGSRFDWVLEIIGFKREPYGEFAVCRRTYDNGRVDNVSISTELLNGNYSFKKI